MRKAGLFIPVLLLPALVLWAIFMVGPALRGIFISFTNEALVGPEAANPRFVGLANYRALLEDPFFYNAVKNSFIFVMGSAVIGQAGLGLLLATLTRSGRRIGRKIALTGGLATTVCYLSWVSPETVIGLSWISYLDKDGFLNQMLGFLGFPQINWIVRFPMLSIIMANVWWGTGWSMMLFKSAIESIPPELGEAAEVDGASGWQRFRYVTLPLIRGPIMVDLILITIWTYGVFGLPLMLTGGGPARRTELMTIYAYRTAFKHFELGYGTTISVAILIITLTLALIYYRILEREE
jgi:multiple sugar transport system permease protein